ncbi:MAG TPA: DUF1963 domain-containing protein [Acidimicrobiales bacterium]|nr:DUF1963 domain-containing protein [Acidimicrobiales bacterium]
MLVALASPSVRLRSIDAVMRPSDPPRHVPSVVPGIGPAVAIGSSERHRVALLADGTVWAWGFNANGQLGDGTKRNRAAPVAVRGLAGVRAIAVGASHSLALTAEGAVYAWGANDKGQVGDATHEDRPQPTLVAGLDHSVRSLAAGAVSSFALLANGTVLGWGDCETPQAVNPESHRSRPEAMETLRGAVSIAGGSNHHLALMPDGRVLAWGSNVELRLGMPTDDYHRRQPAPVPGLPPIVSIAAGASHSLALDAAGTIFAWGGNWFGERGDEKKAARASPQALQRPASVRELAAGRHLSLALSQVDGPVGWGYNSGRLLGQVEERLHTFEPVSLTGLDGDVVAISIGLALRTDGSVLQWGDGIPTGGPAWDDGLPVGLSKLGGRPDLPEGVRWPDNDGRLMTFLAQVALADVAPHDATASLPAQGHLAVFSDLEDPEMPTVVIYAGPGALGRPEPPPGGPTELAGAVVLSPEPELTLPPVESDAVRQLGFSDEEREAYDNVVDDDHLQPRHRMLGHPDIVQNDIRSGPDEQLLLQLDFIEHAVELGEGRMYWYIDARDLARGALDQASVDFQQT